MPDYADIHFDYKLVLLALEAGADKVRINPGTSGQGRLLEVARKAEEKGQP